MTGSRGRIAFTLVFSLLLLGVGSPTAYGQKEELTTEVGVLNVTPGEKAGLSVSPAVRDSSGDGTLQVQESATIEVAVTNRADGPTSAVEVWAYSERGGDQITWSVAGRTAPSELPGEAVRVGQIDALPAGATQSVSTTLRAARTLSGAPVALAVKVRDEYDFAPDEPSTVSLQTEQGGTPALAAADLRVVGPAGSKLQPEGDTTEVVLGIENSGTGTATGVTARMSAGTGGTVVSGSAIDVGTLDPETTTDVRFAVATEGTPETVPVTVRLDGESGRAAAQTRQALAVVQPDRPPLVDRAVPSTEMSRPNAIAVVIGIRDYEHSDVPPVDYALRDARTVKQYLIRTLGFRKENVIVAENASGSELRRLFGTDANPQGQLYNYIREGESEVFVYYSGHGAPDPKTEKAYLLGSNTNPNYMSINGYPVEQLYQNLAQIPAKSVTVALDACFSGVSESGQIVQNVSPAVLSVENPIVGLENGLVFTAGAADQVSSWYPEKKHGLFTYYLLRGLRGHADTNDNQAVTAKEMKAYLTDEVPYWARRMHNREQVPQVVGRNLDRMLVRYADSVPADGE